jgi:uncharacterized repeat protein (TIGR02543 family)
MPVFANYTGCVDEVQNEFTITNNSSNLITYDLDGGYWDGGMIGLDTYDSSNYGYVPPTPVRKGYIFTGWNPEKIAPGTAGDITFTATWRKGYAILEPGKEFNVDIKDLGKALSSYLSVNVSVSSIKFVNISEMPSNVSTIEVQDASSDYVIKAYALVNEEAAKDVYLACDADEIYLNQDCSYMFYAYEGLSSIDFTNFNTEKVKDMTSMFELCTKIETLDLSAFNTCNVVNLSYMFSSCTNLSNLLLSNWNTSQVSDMSYMFEHCSNLNSLDVSGFNTENVDTLAYMFSECGSLSGLDLSNFKTDKVTNMSSMFYGCTSLIDLNLSNFNTENVTDMNFMFEECTGLSYLDLINFDMKNVTSKNLMLSSTASTSQSCIVVCTEETEAQLKSGTNITESYFKFVRSLDDLLETSALSLDMNDDTGDVYTINSLN